MKTVTLKQTGYLIKGRSTLNLWGGDIGEIEMKPTFLALEDFSPKNILRCVNDNGFGCEAIIEAYINIYIQFENGYTEYVRSIWVDNPIHTQYFLQQIEKK